MTTAPSASTDHAAFAALARSIRGTVVTREEAQFEAVRQAMVWNAAKPSRRPEAIVNAASVADVQEAIRFARRNGLKVAIRGRGHSWCASSMRDGGILLDLSGLRDLHIDPAAKRILAQPGVTNAELIAQLAPHGLAFPIGHCATVPLSGYLLAGGIGWNSGKWGPACYSVRGVELVTADGELVRADEQQNSDLFWAARGGGAGFFGAVTRFELQAYPLPSAIRSTNLFFPIRDAAAAGRWLTMVVPTLAREVEVNCVLCSAPPGLPPAAPQAGERMLLVAATAFAESDQEARRMLAPLLSPPEGLRPFVTPVEETPFEQLLAAIGALLPEGGRYTVEACWCDSTAEDLFTRMVRAAEVAPSPRSLVLIALFPRAATERAAEVSAGVALPAWTPAFVGIYGVGQHEQDDAACRAWVASSTAALDDVTSGYYVGETDLTASPERPERCYSPQNWARLRSLKAKHDPTNVFHDYLGRRG